MPLSSGTMCSVPYERRTDMCDEDMIYDCPCTVDCPRHRHCVSCIDHHRKLGWPLVACMQKMLKEHKAQKPLKNKEAALKAAESTNHCSSTVFFCGLIINNL